MTVFTAPSDGRPHAFPSFVQLRRPRMLDRNSNAVDCWRNSSRVYFARRYRMENGAPISWRECKLYLSIDSAHTPCLTNHEPLKQHLALSMLSPARILANSPRFGTSGVSVVPPWRDLNSRGMLRGHHDCLSGNSCPGCSLQLSRDFRG